MVDRAGRAHVEILVFGAAIDVEIRIGERTKSGSEPGILSGPFVGVTPGFTPYFTSLHFVPREIDSA